MFSTNTIPTESLFNGTVGIYGKLKSNELLTRRHLLDELDNQQWCSNRNNIFRLITALLKNGQQQLLLYIPSFLIPSANENTNSTTSDYINTILGVFYDSLENYVPRADFTNGDEPDKSGLISPYALIARLLVDKHLLPESWMDSFDDIVKNSACDDLNVVLDQSDDINPKRDAWLKKERNRKRLKLKSVNNHNLDRSLSNNLDRSEIDKFTDIVNNNVLCDVIYKNIILYGSKLKGYSSETSDIDTAVFALPSVNRELVIDTVHDFLPGSVIYFTGYCDGKLRILDDMVDPYIGAPYDLNIFMNGFWTGDNSSGEFIHSACVQPTLGCSIKFKKFLLYCMARDALHYRLLHRGYENHYDITGPVFFDDGYRLLATKLYLQYILLP